MYLLIQLGYNYLSKGYEKRYTVNGHEVYERYIARTKGEKDSYYIEVKDENDVFILNTYKNFNKLKEIVKDVNIIKGSSYKCAYIELKISNFKSNMTCVKDGIYYNYQDIKGKDNSLDTQVKELNYNLENFVDTAEEVNKIIWEICSVKSNIDTAVTEMDELHHVGCYFKSPGGGSYTVAILSSIRFRRFTERFGAYSRVNYTGGFRSKRQRISNFH